MLNEKEITIRNFKVALQESGIFQQDELNNLSNYLAK